MPSKDPTPFTGSVLSLGRTSTGWGDSRGSEGGSQPEYEHHDAFGRLPASVGHYEVRRLVGVGGMGAVYEAWDHERDHVVALKTLAALSPRLALRFKDEFRLVADLGHRNLVTLYELVHEDPLYFFTMEYLKGVDFLTWVRAGGADGTLLERRRQPGAPSGLPYDEERLRDALRQLASGIQALHENNLLHCDVKPNNVLVEPDGRVVLLDFGLVRGNRVWFPEPGQRVIAGTPLFMAPEQAQAERPARPADWYAVGVILYAALAGRLPFEAASPLRLVRKKQRGRPPRPSTLARRELPADLETLAMELLRPDPRRRPEGPEVLERLGVARPSGRRAPVGPRATDLSFVGREKELADLRAAYASAEAGEATTLWLHGRSGVGKTALLRRFLGELRRRQVLVLAGRCYERETVAYKAFDSVVDALATWLRRLGPEEADGLLPDDTRTLATVFPALKSVEAVRLRTDFVLMPRDEQELRRRAFHGLRELLRRVAARRTTVVCIDDIHWGDRDSAQLLLELLAGEDAPPILLLATFRTDEFEESPLLDELRRHWLRTGRPGGIPLVEIPPLPEEATVALAEALLGDEGAERAATIAQEAQGNPFLVEQLVQQAVEEPRAETAGAADRLQAFVGARYRALPDEDRALLRVVVTAGRPIAQRVAARAAGVGGGGSAPLARLRAAHLVRTRGPRETDAVECYHDRLRSSLAAEFSDPERADTHRAVALAIEAEGRDEWDVLAEHWHAAGEATKGAEFALRAAERAREMLAFYRAARLFGMAAAWGEPATQRKAELQRQQADALVLAGRCAEAAPLFLASAEGADPETALELQRKAAEQLLISGRIQEGTDLLRRLMEPLKVGFPETPGRAMVSALFHALRLALRGLGFRERALADVPPELLRRLALCDTAAKGLAVVDAQRGAWFSLKALGLALKSGEAGSVGRSLAMVGAAILAPAGGPMAAWGRRMLRVAESLAASREDPLLRGLVAVCSGQVHVLSGEYGQALTLCDRGVRTLEDHCHGAAWELNVGRMGALRALEELGEMGIVAQRSAQFLREAEQVGDLYALVTAQLYLAYTRIAADDPSGARRNAEAAIRQWASSDAFHVQHLYALRIGAYCDLYEEQPLKAWARLEIAWPDIKRSMLLKVPITRIDLALLRARTGLAAASEAGIPSGQFLRKAERDVRSLEREGRPDCHAQALLLRAGLAAARRDRDTALARLHEAAIGFDRAGMVLLAAVARRRHAQLLGGDEGAALLGEIDRFMRGRAIVDPVRWTAAHAPGFPGPGGGA